MAKHRHALPQLSGSFTITDGGLETELIFHHGFDLPGFAAFPLVADGAGRSVLREYYEGYLRIARDSGVGIVLESPTWRANPDWASRLGYSMDELDTMNEAAIALLHEVRLEADDLPHVVVSGCIGPRGDGYAAGSAMDAAEARDYHARQIGVFADAGADMAAAITMTTPEEAIGITQAALDAGLPVAISFTVETDGRLPNGMHIGDAIEQVDAATATGPAYYMINCAHPTHFEGVVAEGGAWNERIRGLRANASTKSHAELDEAEELDEGDVTELAASHARLRAHLPSLSVLGGCCGTDHRHVRAMTAAWLVPGLPAA